MPYVNAQQLKIGAKFLLEKFDERNPCPIAERDWCDCCETDADGNPMCLWANYAADQLESHGLLIVKQTNHLLACGASERWYELTDEGVRVARGQSSLPPMTDKIVTSQYVLDDR